jgi:hypothetical protein
MKPSEHLRAADADRQATADRLRVAADEGRLDLDEYDQRLRLAYAATRYADLYRLTADLPAPAPPTRPGLPLAAPAPVKAVAGWIAGLPIGCLVLLVVLVVAILD